MSKNAKALGATRDELAALRSVGAADREASRSASLEALRQERVREFEAKLVEVVENLDMRLREAARRGFLELQLIVLLEPALLVKTAQIYEGRQARIRNGAWRTFNPYPEKSVVLNDALRGLWEMVEDRGLRPFFIKALYGALVFAVQLPDGGPYPRDDDPDAVWERVHGRMDFWICEGGGFKMPSAALKDMC